MPLNKIYLTLFFLFAIVAKSSAQSTPIGVMNVDDLDSLSNKHKRFSPSFYFGTDYYPERSLYRGIYNNNNSTNFNDFFHHNYPLNSTVQDSTIHSTHYEFSFTAPIIRWNKPEGSHQINLYASGSWDKFNMSWFQNTHDLYSGNAGLQYLYYQPKENLFLVHFTVGFANDQNYLNEEIGLRYSGLALFNHLTNPKFQYFFGLATTSAYNETQWIPMVGGKIKITHKDFIRISFPFSKYYEFYPLRFAYYHPLSRRTLLFGEWENQGSSYRIYSADENISSTKTASVQLRQQGESIGIGVRYMLKYNVRFEFELSQYYRNTISIYNIDAKIDDNYLSLYPIHGGVLLQANVKWNFNKNPAKSASPRVDFLDLQSIEVEDLPDDFK